MDNNLLTKTLISNPVWMVLNFLLQNPDLELNDAEISKRIKGVQKSAVNLSLNRLSKCDLVTRRSLGRMKLNKLSDSKIVESLKILSNHIYIQPIVDKIKPACFKIILFGSRANGTHTADSDFDLFVVTNNPDGIVTSLKSHKKIQIVFKTPLQMLSIEKDDPALYREVRKGVILWEKI